MSTVLELIQTVEAAGGRFVIDGDRLGVFPTSAAARAVTELRQKKLAIVELLSRRPKMPDGVLLIKWEPKDSPNRLSESSLVTDTRKFICTTLRQLDAELHGEHWLAAARSA